VLGGPGIGRNGGIGGHSSSTTGVAGGIGWGLGGKGGGKIFADSMKWLWRK
jgi:hypothetical protein